MTLDVNWVVGWTRESAAAVAEHRVELTDLDRAIGDGDHGENLDRGFSAVIAKLDGLPEGSTPADVLKLVATVLISTVGGAAGPLYGTAYLRASAAAGSATELDSTAIAGILRGALDGVVHRGKAEPGDKTMVDAWTPAVEAAEKAAAAGASERDVLVAAADAAAAGAVATEPLVARKGRASYLGERAIGYRDPGAESSALILAAAVRAADASAAGAAE